MMTLGQNKNVVSITRSQTIGNIEQDISVSENSEQKALPKIQRIASNGNFMSSRHNNRSTVSPPGIALERSQSIDTGALGDQLKRSLSLGETRFAAVELEPQSSATQTQENFVAQQPQPFPVLPPSPYLQPQSFAFDPQQQRAHHVVNHLMTPMHSGIAPQSPSYSFMFTPTNYAMSPMYSMQRNDGNYFFPSPYAAPQSPMHMPIQNFQLPSSHMGQPEQEGLFRTVSMRNEASGGGYESLNAQHMHPPQPQQEYYQQYNEEQSPVERMLEELRIKMKGVGNNSRSGHHGYPQGMLPDSTIQWGLKEMMGHAFVFAKDQFGSRFIQQQLENPDVPQADKDKIFKELAPSISALCEDVFGNYVIQKLFEIGVGTKEQHNYIYQNAIKGNMYNLSKHMYGCRVIQKLVEVIFGHTSQMKEAQKKSIAAEDIYSSSTQDMLLMELIDVRTLVTDQNGNHVIQKCISSIKPNQRLKMFYAAFQGQYAVMAKHPYGCRVVQRVLENASLTEVEEVIKELQHHLHDMIQNQYANYVIQHIIQRQKNLSPSGVQNGGAKGVEAQIIAHINSFREQLYELLSANVLLYSKHKFGSNVVECSIKHGLPKEKSKVIKRILDPTCLVQMMQDQYANYVVQKVIDNATQVQKNDIINIVSQNELALRRLTFGKHIINKLKSQSY